MHVLVCCVITNLSNLEPGYSNIASTNPTVFLELALRLKIPGLLKAVVGQGLELETCQRLGSSGIRLLDEDWLSE